MDINHLGIFFHFRCTACYVKNYCTIFEWMTRILLSKYQYKTTPFFYLEYVQQKESRNFIKVTQLFYQLMHLYKINTLKH